jgi:DNA repair exonuclease SbcCD ATPase subunit
VEAELKRVNQNVEKVIVKLDAIEQFAQSQQESIAKLRDENKTGMAALKTAVETKAHDKRDVEQIASELSEMMKKQTSHIEKLVKEIAEREKQLRGEAKLLDPQQQSEADRKLDELARQMQALLSEHKQQRRECSGHFDRLASKLDDSAQIQVDIRRSVLRTNELSMYQAGSEFAKQVFGLSHPLCFFFHLYHAARCSSW